MAIYPIKEYCIANTEYKLTGNAYGTVTVTGTPEAPADNDQIIADGIAGAKDYIENAYQNWQYQYGDEWAVFSLTRTGEALTDEQIEYYLNSVAEAYAAPKAAELKLTTIARVILGRRYSF